VDDLIGSLVSNCGQLCESMLFELKVVLNEVLINAIRHGNREDESKVVKIKAGITSKSVLFVIIEDEGCGYDFAEVCNGHGAFANLSEPPDMSENGRGIMIVKTLCDRVRVNTKGNKIVIMKTIERITPLA